MLDANIAQEINFIAIPLFVGCMEVCERLALLISLPCIVRAQYLLWMEKYKGKAPVIMYVVITTPLYYVMFNEVFCDDSSEIRI